MPDQACRMKSNSTGEGSMHILPWCKCHCERSMPDHAKHAGWKAIALVRVACTSYPEVHEREREREPGSLSDSNVSSNWMHYLHARACLHDCFRKQGVLLLLLTNHLQVVLIKRQIMVHPPYLVCSWPCNSSNVHPCNMHPWHVHGNDNAVLHSRHALGIHDHVCASSGLLEACPDLLLWAEGAHLGHAWVIGLATGKWQDNDREREHNREWTLDAMHANECVYIYIHWQVLMSKSSRERSDTCLHLCKAGNCCMHMQQGGSPATWACVCSASPMTPLASQPRSSSGSTSPATALSGCIFSALQCHGDGIAEP